MASRLSWNDPTARSGDIRIRKAGGSLDYKDETPGWRPRKGMESGQYAAAYIPSQSSQPQPRVLLSSRIPQTSSYKRPSVPDQSERPSLNHQPQSWGSGGSVGSGRSAGNLGFPSSSPAPSTGSRLPGPSQRRNMLRRKRSGLPPVASTKPGNSRSGSASTSTSTNTSISSSFSVPRSQDSIDGTFGAPFDCDSGLTESPMEVRLAQWGEAAKTTAQTVTIYPEFDRYRDVQHPVTDANLTHFEIPFRLATHDLPPPTPVFSGTSSQMSGFSGSPSTRFSESPGMSTGPYSRDTTPTSMSSQSPGLVAPMRFPPASTRGKQGSPAQTRPPVTRRRAASIPNEVESISADPHGLAAVRESLTSSSSNSTVRNVDGLERKDSQDRPSKKKRLSPLPPSPPPRKSSQRSPHRQNSSEYRVRSNSRDEEISPTKLSRNRGQPETTSMSPAKATSSSRNQPLTSPKTTPPIRPTRDGTPDLQSQLGIPVPVIQSNLFSTSRSERRRSFLLPPASSSRPDIQERSQSQPRIPLGRQPTPTTTTTTSSAGEGQTAPDADIEADRRLRTPSPSVSTFRTRFPLFGRRTKTASDASTTSQSEKLEKKDKPARKGPAAGTGHEGYGRLGAARRRSGSVTNLAHGPSGTTTAQDNLGYNQSTDSFLMDRIAPVVIAGGEVINNQNQHTSTSTSTELSRNESNQSFSYAVSGTGSKNNSRLSVSSKEAPRLTLWPSAFPRASSQAPSIRSRRPSDSSESEAPVARKPTLAYRRSMQKLQSGDQQAPRIPKPIVTRAQIISPSVTSLDASLMSDESLFSPVSGPGRGRADGAVLSSSSTTNILLPPKKLTKRVRSPHRWNFFGRSQSRPAAHIQDSEPVANTVAATVKVVQSRPEAFYTMMEASEQDDADVPDLQEVVREARDLASPPLEVLSPAGRRPSAAESVGPETTSQEVGSPQSTVLRQRRPSVGRSQSREGRVFDLPSPPVLSAGERRPSFSRPFHRVTQPEASGSPISRPSLQSPAPAPAPAPAQPQLQPQPQQQQPEAPTMVAPRAVEHATCELRPAPIQPLPTAPPRPATGRPSRLPQVGRIPKVVRARPEPTISPRSFSRPFHRLSAQFTAPQPPVPIPAPDTEFVAKGPTPPRQATPEPTQAELITDTGGHGQYFRQARQSRDMASDSFQGTKEFLSFSPRKNSQSTTTTSSCSSGMSYTNATAVVPEPSAPLAEDEIWDEYNDLLVDDPIKVPPSAGSSLGKPFHLEMYNSQLASKPVERPLESPTVHGPQTMTLDGLLQPKPRPLSSCIDSTDKTSKSRESLDVAPNQETQLSVTDIVSGLRDDRKDSMMSELAPSIQRTSASSTIQAQGSRKSHASSSSSSQSSEDNSSLAQVNLRVGSMTVSKWLTFGHVLFSPAREDLISEVGTLKRHSILVIDGLGNDDWGFYAAETYPAATFFNLSPRAPLPVAHQSSAGYPLSPPNHHQIQYMSHIDKLPFGPESFTSVVFRFPTAAPESHYKNVISEARRVLKPGGYIELAILDVDLNNMGNKGRRAVRHLKEQIHANAPDTCLGSAADLILRLLGRKGFIDVKTCRVGVPVASTLTRTSGSEATFVGSSASDRGKSKHRKDERTLAEMMNDESEVADESITKMVAKVGRWWYNRCYESAANAGPGDGPGSARSMWSDKALLAECEEWGTSLKLMVCHARVPESKVRVASI